MGSIFWAVIVLAAIGLVIVMLVIDLYGADSADGRGRYGQY